MSKLNQVKIPISFEPRYRYELKRIDDGLTKNGLKVVFISWNADGTYQEVYNEPGIGRSLMLDPSMSWNWLTTTITEILEQTDDYLKFRTLNSTYELTTLI